MLQQKPPVVDQLFHADIVNKKRDMQTLSTTHSGQLASGRKQAGASSSSSSGGRS